MQNLKTTITLLILLLNANLYAQPFHQELDSIIKKKMPPLGLHQLTINWSEYESTPLTDIQRFDKDGNRIEHLSFNGNRWTRHKEEFNEKGRRTTFSFFDDQDTSLLVTKHVYTYIDSLNYTDESFNFGKELSRTTLHQTKVAKDTFWVTEIETSANNKHVSKSLSRYTLKGDSLTISEFVHFDRNGKMSDIDAYYQLQKKDKNGNIVYTSGIYDVVVDESLHNDQALYMDVIKYPEKYIQYQLDGKFPYTYGEEVTSKHIYNSKGKIISSYDYGNRKMYSYNSRDQLIKIDSFSSPLGSKEEKVSEQTFLYDSHGLPVKVIETRSQSGKTITYTFEYK
jgi:hypothetical protein